MGDRGNIKVIMDSDGDDTVHLYTHWYGSNLPSIVSAALNSPQARARWQDGPYLARILFCRLVGQKYWGSETGFGISVKLGDGASQIITVNVPEQTVTDWHGNTVSFEDYATKIDGD